MTIDRPNQVWAADITYIPIGRGLLYLVAVIDWASRAVLAWRLSNTLDTRVCMYALEWALDGQRVHRTAVALAQVRGHLSEGLRRWPRGQSRDRELDQFL